MNITAESTEWRTSYVKCVAIIELY
jgi:hypothetical protein